MGAGAVTSRDRREPSYAPRGLRREAAAIYVGFGPTKFDQMVEDGRMPKGKLVDGCRVWDRCLLDMAFEALADDEAAPDIAPEAKAWAAVR
jgi:hypothetical protein